MRAPDDAPLEPHKVNISATTILPMLFKRRRRRRRIRHSGVQGRRRKIESTVIHCQRPVRAYDARGYRKRKSENRDTMRATGAAAHAVCVYLLPSQFLRAITARAHTHVLPRERLQQLFACAPVSLALLKLRQFLCPYFPFHDSFLAFLPLLNFSFSAC